MDHVPSVSCNNCGRPWGTGIACQFCHQLEGLPAGVTLCSPGRRLMACLVDLLIAVVPLVFIYMAVFMFAWLTWGAGVIQAADATPRSARTPAEISALDANIKSFKSFTESPIFQLFNGLSPDGLLAGTGIILGYVGLVFLAAANGRTPAKHLLGMRVVHLSTGRTASFGRMLLRDAIARPIVAFFGTFLMAVPLFWLVWDKNNQALWDKIAETVVVNHYVDQRYARPVDALHPKVSVQ